MDVPPVRRKRTPSPERPRAWFNRLAVTVAQLLIVSEQETLHLNFFLGPPNYVTGLVHSL